MHNLSDTFGDRFVKTHVVTGVWHWYWKGGSHRQWVQQDLFTEPHLSKYKAVLGLAAKQSSGIHTVYVANRHSGTMRASDPYIQHVQVRHSESSYWARFELFSGENRGRLTCDDSQLT